MKRITLAAVALLCGCSPSAAPEGLMPTPFGSGATVKFDIYHRPLPDIPLPNDFATRFDPSSPTKLRVNASMVATTEWEVGARRVLDGLDGWGTFGSVSLGFSEPLDLHELARRHQHDDYDFTDDAVFLVDVTQGSPDYCQPVPLDMGEGNFPLVLENRDFGLSTDTRIDNEQLLFDETNEDLNGNGALDPGEDTDLDGVLDRGNYLRDTDSRFDLLSFYERESNTLIMKPVMPMRENTVYAAVITRRVVDDRGRPVRSPFEYINHAAQTRALEPLVECLPGLGLTLEDLSFTWSFTTQSTTRDYVAVRDGLYGLGPMQRLATEFPAHSSLLRMKRNTPAGAPHSILSSEDLQRLTGQLLPMLGGDGPRTQAIRDSYRWVDFTAVGQLTSPQFFRRTAGPTGQYGEPGPNGEPLEPLPLYQQVFDLDPVTGAAFTRPETLTYWLTVPKGRNGKPAPVVILGHGYTSAKLEMINYGGYFARLGMATLAIDCVSHGADLGGDKDLEIAKAVFAAQGFGDFFSALTQDRAVDLNHDGTPDPGADYWTSYLLHTRDVVKQSTIDHMQLIRVLRSFDGSTKWVDAQGNEVDVNRDGVTDLAGDFDGDGVVDVGGAASVHMTGGSLGGIMSVMVGGLEPAIETVVPVAGGAGLADVGVRSIQGGVKEAVNWRMFGPYIATQRNAAGGLELAEWVPELNKKARLKLATFDVEPKDGDSVVIRNLRSGEYRCTRVHGGGQIGGAVSSDRGDGLSVEIYAGVLPSRLPEGCEVPAGAEPTHRFETLQEDVTYMGQTYAKGSPLIAFTDGFGLRRNNGETRRFMSIGQVALDSADPVNMAPFFERWLLKYGTGEEVRTRALVVNTIGDMNVPVATGVSIARAAGFIDLTGKDARYGKTANRVLIDEHVLEAVERAGPWRNSLGQPVLKDVDHYSAVTGVDDGYDVPRLDPPLRLVRESPRLGGYSGMMLPMQLPTGKHGFDAPNPAVMWDLGGFMFATMGRYMATDGKELKFEPCSVTFSCPYMSQTPPQD